MIPTLPKAILLDWDGTLVDSYSFLERGHNFVLGQFNMPLFQDQDYKKYFGMPRDEIYIDIYGQRSEEAKTLFEDFVAENHAKLLNACEGAQNLLEAISKLKIPAGIVSNKKHSFITREAKTFGWSSHIQTIVGAGDAKADKPSADPLHLAAKNLNLTDNIKQIWYIGDTEIDMKAAQNSGTKPIYVHPNHKNHSWLEAYAPVLAVENCTQLRDFLLQCAEN